jgi:hypothetical protein
MTQDNSACSDDLGRRRFLGGFLGLGTGAAAFGAVPPRPSLGREEADLGAHSSPMNAYERRLSETRQMEVLGCPRDWSVIQQRFHPFHPQRIIILPSGTPLEYGSRCGRQLRMKLDEEIQQFQGEIHRSAPLPAEKLESTFWIMDVLTGHYRVPELFEAWVLGLAGRETFGSSTIGNHLGLVHQFQKGDEIEVDCPPLDWWLFLFPDGIDWDHPGGESVHALIGHVSRFPWWKTTSGLMYQVWSLAQGLSGEVVDWRRVSRMGRIDGARHLNEITVRLLEEKT